MVTMMSLNRTTSIFAYFLYEKIWQFLFPFSLGTVVLCAVYFTRTILVTSPYYVYNEALDMYSIKADSFLLQIDPSRSTVLGQVAQVLLPFFSDFLTISQPYILILMSSKVRLEMLKMYFGKSPKVGVFFVKSLGRQSGSRASQVPRN
ncbi:hypothetical protein L3Y34_005568 [Caenorhabditis briggsae]|uniref:Serpentine receptor class gamma n=1 Tax=Caenorhabditis briggsae TaxID=6238 RepID=A0AAE9D6A2_CAEBR|nr:hypothetical protein L3Y34_005568 [Caenorhabditis briggsae]